MRFLIGKSSIQANGLFAVAIVAAWAVSCSAGLANDGMASNAIVHRAGLKVQWFTHSGAAVTTRLVDWQLNVNENNPTTFYTITAGDYRETFSQDKIDAFGNPMGADGAVQYADIRKDILLAELANDGKTDVEVEIGQYSLPETTLYVLTSSGVVTAIDADSGAAKWSTRIGTPSLPSIGLGSNDNYVAAINGSSVYCLEAKTGKVIWSKKCRYAVGASPAVSDEKIYVPLLNGRLEAFKIEDEGFASFAMVATGEGTARPVVTEKTVTWPNSRGTMSVAARYGKSRIAYQLQADDAIVSPVIYDKGMFFVTSLDGFVYAIDEDRGSIAWQVSTGTRISELPFPMGGFVFVINEEQELYKFDAKTGIAAPGWESPRKGIQQFVGAGKDNLYVLDPVGSLVVITQDSGTKISTVNFGDVDRVLPNLQNDRLYVATKRGMIQCVREIASPIPHFHSGDFVVAGDVTQPMGKSEEKKAESDAIDPFGAGDPFGGDKQGDSKKTDSDSDADIDPFGGGADDKGKSSGGSGEGDEDPFGG